MAVLVVCGVNEQGRREILAVEPMAEESRDSYKLLFQTLKNRGLETPKLVISDAHSGLIAGWSPMLNWPENGRVIWSLTMKSGSPEQSNVWRMG